MNDNHDPLLLLAIVEWECDNDWWLYGNNSEDRLDVYPSSSSSSALQVTRLRIRASDLRHKGAVVASCDEQQTGTVAVTTSELVRCLRQQVPQLSIFRNHPTTEEKGNDKTNDQNHSADPFCSCSDDNDDNDPSVTKRKKKTTVRQNPHSEEEQERLYTWTVSVYDSSQHDHVVLYQTTTDWLGRDNQANDDDDKNKNHHHVCSNDWNLYHTGTKKEEEPTTITDVTRRFGKRFRLRCCFKQQQSTQSSQQQQFLAIKGHLFGAVRRHDKSDDGDSGVCVDNNESNDDGVLFDEQDHRCYVDITTTTNTTTTTTNYKNRLVYGGQQQPQTTTKETNIKTIVLEQDPNTPDTTGVCLWDGAILLVKFLEQYQNHHHHSVPSPISHQQHHHPTNPLREHQQPQQEDPTIHSLLSVRNKHVLELGAGIGFVGIAAAILGARSVLLTDLRSCLPLMRHNVERNRHLFCENEEDGNGTDNNNNPHENHSCNGTVVVQCEEYDWFHQHNTACSTTFQRKEGDDKNYPTNGDQNNSKSCPDSASCCCCLQRLSRLDLILVADCVWLVELVEPLLQTLLYVVTRFPTAAILLSYQRRGRSTHEALVNGLAERFSRVQVLHHNHHNNNNNNKSGGKQDDVLQVLLIQL